MLSHFRLLILLFVTLSGGAIAIAADVTARATLSSTTTEVDEPIQLSIDVENARGRIMTPEVTVDGLDVDYRGSSQSSQMQFGTGGFSGGTRLTLRYEVMPKREGTFTIPALTVVVDGQTLQTKPVALKVQKGSGRKAPASGVGGDNSATASAFAEIVLKKKNAYIGETVPIELRFLVDERIRLGEVGNFDLSGEGFTVQKAGKPEERKETRDGKRFDVGVFRSVLTPGKAGKLVVGPSKIPFVAQMPVEQRDNRNRRMSPLERFFGDDPFFGAQRWTAPQRYDAEAPAAELEVKPLPVEGRPNEFSGAVGQFQFNADSSATRVKIGEPVAMRLRIAGEGNFDRVQAPVLVDPNGWQAYDASEKFEPSNELKTSGTKTFEMPVVPQNVHKQTPQFAFSFFDPISEKYVTQTSKPTALVVEGQPAPVPPSEPATPTTTSAPPTAQEPEKASASSVIAPLSYELGAVGDFRPIHQRPNFWIFQAGAGILALGLAAVRLLRSEPEQKRAANLRRERDHLLRTLRSGTATEDFFEDAARVLQIATACKTGVDPNCVDAPAAKSALAQEDELASQIDEIFDRRGALLYAGGGGGSDLSRSDRERIISALQRACER